MTRPRKSAKRSAAGRPDRPVEDEIWHRVTRELTDDLAVDALARDRAGKSPLDELARLQEAGLPALLTPPSPDGRRGADWRAASAVIREISTADSSIGELLAHHYALAWSARFFGTEDGKTATEPVETVAEREGWLLAGGVESSRAETGTETPDLVLTPESTDEPGSPEGGGFVLEGRRYFASGVTVADRLVVGARCTGTGDLLIVLVDPAHPAVFTEPATDRLGQRLSGAGTVTFDRAPVAAEAVLGRVPRDEHDVTPYAALAPLALRLLLVQVGLGIAEGALAEARDVSRAGHAAQPHSVRTAAGHAVTYAPRDDDPYLLLAYGELATAAHAAASVAGRATDALARGLDAGGSLGVEERADIAVLVAAAEAVTDRAAVHVTTRILELVGSADRPEPAGSGPGFDRFWRNARALTARHSPTHRLRDIGDHYLNGTHARLTLPV
ncbi:acyl-CoA dehydrogenase family protein [Streptomyces solicathayae]|uniref:Acyl-CoA dehydrogenase family protein n=1 Tax=Streptomyces solicathayae TaxID=3081768 RepID=A0ABZ0M2M0_9ACTN|nr:acyl-CoA dehydrogenase family protein [Streptomyces sp. HUAS YS2]WOX26021.1 acyl-CoA dehydrogenase family protein [Streptomyces sp. HUAS YS2]